jgi:hypothetical protein
MGMKSVRANAMAEEHSKIQTFGSESPRVTFFVGVHGNERASLRGLQLLQERHRLRDLKESLQVVHVHQRALSIGQRYVERDLNDSFPGKPDGCLEERVAFELTNTLRRTTYNFDFHSTSFDCPPYGIFSQLGGEIPKIIKGLRTEHYVFNEKNSLIRNMPNGIAYEVGDENDPRSAENAYELMVGVLALFRMIPKTLSLPRPNNPATYLIYDVLRRSMFQTLDPKIRDFARVQKGDRLGLSTSGGEVLANEAFVPIWVNHPDAIRMAKQILICDWEGEDG